LRFLLPGAAPQTSLVRVDRDARPYRNHLRRRSRCHKPQAIRRGHSSEQSIPGSYGADEVIGCNINVLMPQPNQTRHDDYLRHYKETGKCLLGESTGCSAWSLFGPSRSGCAPSRYLEHSHQHRGSSNQPTSTECVTSLTGDSTDRGAAGTTSGGDANRMRSRMAIRRSRQRDYLGSSAS
jgi:hypothetical protein